MVCLFGAPEFRTKAFGQVCQCHPSLPGTLLLVSALQKALEARSGPSVLVASAAQMAVLPRGVAARDMASLMTIC